MRDAGVSDGAVPDRFILNVILAGDGEGLVRSLSPLGLDCGGNCALTVEAGTQVTLEAVPVSGSEWAGWSEPGCTTTTCRLTVNANTTVRVTFDSVVHRLTVTRAGTGTGLVVSPNREIDCGDTCSVQLQRGASIALVATADPGSRFVAWSGGCFGSERTCTLAVDGPLDVSATFDEAPCELDSPDAVTVIGLYGQSLAVGTDGNPALTTSPPFPNDVFVLDATMTSLCPAREGGTCGPWPDAETSRTAIASTWRALRGNGKFIINNAAAGGLTILQLARGTTPYTKLMNQIQASYERAAALPGGPTAVVRAIAFVHGPSDEPYAGYEEKLRQLVVDVNVDVRSITGQTAPVHFFIDQTSSWSRSSVEPNVALEQLAACRSDSLIHCVGPQFYLDYSTDRVHLVNTGYRENGERFGAAMWRTLENCEDASAPYAIGAEATGSTIRALFHVANPPLSFDTTRCPEFDAMGFELHTETIQPVEITSVQLASADTVELTTNVPVAANAFELRYAWSGETIGGGDCRLSSPRSPGGNLIDEGPSEAWPTTDDRSSWAMTHHVPVVGGVVPPAPTLGASIRLDGPTEHVEVRHATNLVAGTQMTISAWLRVRTPVHNRVVLEKAPEWSIRTFDNGQARELVFHTDGFTNGVRSATDGIDLFDGQWHHVAVSYESGQVRWVVDCRDAGGGSGAATIPDAAAVMRIGHHQFAADVDLADVAIFDDALDDAGIFDLCRSPVDLCNGSCTTTTLASGLPISWWRPQPTDDPTVFNGIADLGPGNNHGTGMNGASLDCGWPMGAPCGPNGSMDGGVGDGGARDGGVPDAGANPDAGPARDGGFSGPTSLAFDGVMAHAEIGAPTVLDGATAATIAGWVEQGPPLDVNGYIFNRYATGGRQFALFTRAANVRVYLPSATTTGDFCETTDGRLVAGQWHHIAAVFDGAGGGNAQRLMIYVDGTVSPMSCTGSIPSQLTSVGAGGGRFGCFSGSVSSCFGPGRLSHWGIWDEALTSAHLAEVIATRGPLVGFSTAPSAEHSWTFDNDLTDTGVSTQDLPVTLVGGSLSGGRP